MTYRQLITPNPHIPCKPGWCLAYVNEAFGVAKRYGTATAAWEASTTKHTDRNFPRGVWTPVWYALDTTWMGHVVLLAPDGSVYSTSDLTNTPHHHPDLADLEAYYAHYGMTLTYRGWTEDVEATPVLAPNITTQAAPSKGALMALTDKEQDEVLAAARRVNTYLDTKSSDIKHQVWGYKNLEKVDAWQILRDIRNALKKAP